MARLPEPVRARPVIAPRRLAGSAYRSLLALQRGEVAAHAPMLCLSVLGRKKERHEPLYAGQSAEGSSALFSHAVADADLRSSRFLLSRLLRSATARRSRHRARHARRCAPQNSRRSALLLVRPRRHLGHDPAVGRRRRCPQVPVDRRHAALRRQDTRRRQGRLAGRGASLLRLSLSPSRALPG